MTAQLKKIHFRLLCYSLREDAKVTAPRAEALILSSSVDWDQLIIAAELHAVRPQLHRLLQSIDTDLVPPVFMEKLHAAVKENQFRQLNQLGEFLSVKAMLEHAGIRAIPFKGFVVAENFYKDISARESADVDIYIQANDLPKTRELMFDRGYLAEAPLGELTDEYILGQLCEYNFDKYHGSHRAFHFEMHWRPGMTTLGMNISLRDLSNEITTTLIQNREVETFSPSAQLLLLIMHHGGKDQFLQLKQVLDIAMIMRHPGPVDWTWVHETANKYHVEKLLYVGLVLASKLTKATIPTLFSSDVNTKEIQLMAVSRLTRMETRAAHHNGHAQFNDFMFRLRSRTSNQLRLQFITRELKSTLVPRFIPSRFHHYFFNKKIRQEAT